MFENSSGILGVHKDENKWSSFKKVPQFSDNVEILKIEYKEKYNELNDYFRGVLQQGSISKLAYDLTTEIINVFINYY